MSCNFPRGGKKVTPSIFFSESINNYKKCTQCNGCILHKVQIIFSQRLPYYQHTFSNFACTYTCRLRKVYAETSEIFTHAVFQLFVARKRCPRSASFRGPKRWKKEDTKSGLKGGWRLDPTSFLVQNVELVFLVFLVSTHIAVNWLGTSLEEV